RRLTSGPERKGSASLSADGTKLLYSGEEQQDQFAVFLKDLANERELKRLRDGFFSLIEPDGLRYVYADDEGLLTKSVGWWPFWSHRLCKHCGMPRAFSGDGNKLLLWTTSPIKRMQVVDVQTESTDDVTTAGEDISGPEISPDGRWVSFVVKMGEHSWQTLA